ncbi:TMV resistance protein N-like [Hevea brasiliensis]|uniref:TMV resistance protein N-like n=1 Tax=Hevea brasiliensis TaxID=3981 RepID=UPI0025EE0600|nr:TMV resistance protein N-like [Hevea brasiliensis]
MAASSSSCPFDAFLSFRGDDVRKTFADHVYAALTGAGIHPFRDDEEIKRGKNIDQELTKAIQQSKVAVIVFSPDYASSRWCLDELLMINERRKSDVRRQKESLKEAFDRHEQQLKEEIDKVERWRAALKKVADLGGEVLKDQYEASFIQNIVKLVANKLDRKLLHNSISLSRGNPGSSSGKTSTNSLITGTSSILTPSTDVSLTNAKYP